MLAADLMPLHHFCCVTNMVFIEDVIWVSLNSQIMHRFDYMNSTLHFCKVVSVNTLCTNAFKILNILSMQFGTCT